jgi:ABC-2 type transport system permease protein
MNLRMVAALVQKDIALYFKNRFFALVTVLGLVVYVAVFFALPRTVDETLQMGWFGPSLPELLNEDLEGSGLALRDYPSEEALREAVQAGDEPVGVALPENFTQQLASGGKPQVRIYYQSEVPEEYRQAYTLLLQELGYFLAGQPLNVESEEIVLGPDMAGRQVPPRQRMLPVLAVFILMIESWGLASLISTEVETGTLRALLVTPLKVEGLFLSKGITGVLMSFSQVLLLLGITGGLAKEPLLVLIGLLLGALLVTGLSFLIASVSRDMMSVLAWGMLAMIVLAIPAFNVLLPGLASNWIKVIPSYYIVDTIYRVINFNAGWSQVNANLMVLLAQTVAFFGLGVLSLGRKLQ